MKCGSKAGILAFLIVAGAGWTASAELKENPYQVIVDRNPFGLRPPPPPPVAVVETNAPVTPPPEIKLTGITTLLGTARVMLQVEDKQSKKFLFPTIAEGDSDSLTGISVLAIDTENMKVRIKNGDAETTLDFKNNGVKPGGGGIAAATPVPQPGLNPGGIPVPGAPNAAAAAAANSSRGAIVAGGMSTTPMPGANNAATPYGSTPLPQRQVRDNVGIIGGGVGGQVYNPNAPAIPQAQPAMTREEAEMRIEMARERLKQQQQGGQPGMPSPSILPPTRISSALNPPPGGSTPAPGQR